MPAASARCFVAAAALALACAVGAAQAQTGPRTPSQVTLPDGRQMSYICAGDGPITVVIDTGIGLPMWSWNQVLDGLRTFARACAYDRAGYPGSSAGPMPRDADHAVADLRAMLLAAGLPAPYVLVGETVGGFNVRLYADRYPHDVAGLVLVDPGFADEPKALAKASPALAKALADEGRVQQLCLGALIKGKVWADNDPTYADCGPAPRGDAVSRAKAILSEETSFNTSAGEAARAHHGRPDLPVIVLTSERTREDPPGMTPAERAAVLQVAVAGHQAIAAGYARGLQRTVTGSAEVMQVDRPAAVIAAVREVIGQLR
ncbi:MAG TPA: alpha/beta hydrolase [Caulobacteraceae bacterium]|nr:alpha/beta hydrolase [Caulobacteraceae bacterium]